MTVVVVAPPTVFPVSRDDAKKHLRVDFDDDDAAIDLLIAAATAIFDGPDSTLGRSLLKQTLSLKLDAFPCAANNFDVWDRQRFRSERAPFYFESWRQYLTLQQIPLPYPPYIGALSITYTDPAGNAQTVDPSTYRIIGGGSARTRVTLKVDQSWPASQFSEEAVSIQWDAGYGTTADKVPAPLRSAILLMIGHLYENRQSVIVDASRVQAIELPQGVESLISPYRILI